MRGATAKAAAAVALIAAGVVGAKAAITLNNAVTGEVLNLEEAGPEGKDTEAFKTFIETGRNIYNGKADCLAKGEQTYLAMCSGCHGQKAEGKLGPGLNDSYWTYPQGATDKGFFEIIFGGASGQMGPMYGAMNVDDMLLTMAWVRHLYKDKPEDAGEWLTDELKASFKPYDGKTPTPKPGANAPETCKVE
ncbi:cytochrome c(L), periplasmic [Methylopila turkensis]|nr:cytochrome c(L), periplasmic [Methylopila turkensis]